MPANHSSDTTDPDLPTPNLLRMFMMLSFSITFGSFTKVSFKIFGSLFHDDDMYLTDVGQLAFGMATISYFVWSLLNCFMGFKSTYTIILCIQIFISFSIMNICNDRLLYKIWISMACVCEAGHYAIIPVFIQ